MPAAPARPCCNTVRLVPGIPAPEPCTTTTCPAPRFSPGAPMTRSALADRCDICVYLDDPPTNANVDVGVGWEWIEWSTEAVADCLWFVQHALTGCAVEHLV